MAFSDTDTVVLSAETGGRGLGEDQAPDRPTDALSTGAPAWAGGWGPVSTGTIHRAGWPQSWGDFHKEITPMPQPNLGVRAQGDRQHHPPGAQIHSSDPRDALRGRRPVPACTPITGVGTAGRTHRTPPASVTHACGLLCCVTLDHRLTQTHTATHAHTLTLTHTLTTHYHSHTLRHTHSDTWKHTDTLTFRYNSHTQAHSHTLSHSYTLAIHSHPYTHSHTFSNTRTHTLTPCPTHTFTHSHAHTTLTSEEPFGSGDSLPLQHRLRTASVRGTHLSPSLAISQVTGWDTL